MYAALRVASHLNYRIVCHICAPCLTVRWIQMPFGRYTCGVQWHIVVWPSRGREICGSKSKTCNCKLLLPPANTNERFCILLNYFGFCYFYSDFSPGWPMISHRVKADVSSRWRVQFHRDAEHHARCSMPRGSRGRTLTLTRRTSSTSSRSHARLTSSPSRRWNSSAEITWKALLYTSRLNMYECIRSLLLIRSSFCEQ